MVPPLSQDQDDMRADDIGETVFVEPSEQLQYNESYDRTSVDIMWSQGSSQLDAELNNAGIQIPTLSSQSKLSAFQPLPTGGSNFSGNNAPKIPVNFIPLNVLEFSNPLSPPTASSHSAFDVDKFTNGPQSIFETFKDLKDENDNILSLLPFKVGSSQYVIAPSLTASAEASTAIDYSQDENQGDPSYVPPIDRGLKLITIGSRPHSRGSFFNERLKSRDGDFSEKADYSKVNQEIIPTSNDSFENHENIEEQLPSDTSDTRSSNQNNKKLVQTENIFSKESSIVHEIESISNLSQRMNIMLNLVESSRPTSRLTIGSHPNEVTDPIIQKNSPNIDDEVVPETVRFHDTFNKQSTHFIGSSDIGFSNNLETSKFADDKLFSKSLDTIFNLDEDILANVNNEIEVSVDCKSTIEVDSWKSGSNNKLVNFAEEDKVDENTSTFSNHMAEKAEGENGSSEEEKCSVPDIKTQQYHGQNLTLNSSELPKYSQNPPKKRFSLISGTYSNVFKPFGSEKSEGAHLQAFDTIKSYRRNTISHKFLRKMRRAEYIETEKSLESGKSLEGLAKDYAKMDYQVPSSRDLAGKDIEDTKKIMSFGNLDLNIYGDTTLSSIKSTDSTNKDTSINSRTDNTDPMKSQNGDNAVLSGTSRFSLKKKSTFRKTKSMEVKKIEQARDNSQLLITDNETATKSSPSKQEKPKSLRFSKYFTIYAEDGSNIGGIIRSGSKRITGPVKSVLKYKK